MTDKFLEKKEKILDSALQIFVAKGYSRARMDDIVEKSGMSKGSIYYHYKSKKDLFLSLIDHWETHAFPNFYEKNKIEMSASEILNSFAKVVADVFEKRKYVFLAEVEFWALANRDADVQDRARILYKKILILFEKVMIKGINAGEFKKINPRLAAIAIMTSLQGVNWFCIFDHKEFTVRDYLIEVINIMVQGFRIETSS